MSNNLLSQTKKFISHIDELTQNSNSQEIHTTAKNIVDEYSEIKSLELLIDNSIRNQLDMSDFYKSKQEWDWQQKASSNWILVHENYHSLRDSYFRRIDNFCNHYYSFTNFFSNILVEILPHEFKKDISTKSFRTFINSLKDNKEHPYFVLVGLGKEVSSNNNYRSTELNHRRLRTSNTPIMTRFEPTTKKIIELSKNDLDVEFSGEWKAPEKFPDDIIVQTIFDKSNNIVDRNYVLHHAVSEPINKINKKTNFMPMSLVDPYGHLKKYGNHFHIFSRPGFGNKKDLLINSGETKISTPDLWKAIIDLQKIIKKTINVIGNFDFKEK